MHRFAYRIVVLLIALTLVAEQHPGHAEEYPRRASDNEAALLVRVRGQGVCTGSPVMHTNLVITAAHCVLDHDTGRLAENLDFRVERNDVRYDIDRIIVDQTRGAGVFPGTDAAVLVMRTPVPGPGVVLAEHFTGTEATTLIVYQPLDSDGTWLRGKNYDDKPSPKGTKGGVTYIAHRGAACDVAPAGAIRRDDHWSIRCGMVPGGSGGPFVSYRNGTPTLVGVLSTVSYDLRKNGIVPVEQVRYLIENEERFVVDPDTATRPRATHGIAQH